MHKKANKIILSLLSLFLFASCKGGGGGDISEPSEDITDIPPISEDTNSETGGGGGGIVGNPIEEGQVPKQVDIYVNLPGPVSDYQLWLWCDGVEGEAYALEAVDADWAKKTVFTEEYPSIHGLMIILRSKDSWAWQTPDCEIKYSNFGEVDDVMSVYCLIGDGNVIELYHRADDALGDKLNSAEFISFNSIRVNATAKAISYDLYANDELLKSYEGKEAVQTLALDETAKLDRCYEVRASFPDKPDRVSKRKVSLKRLYTTQEFINNYTYDGDDLGATYTPTATTFKLWAPGASKVTLNTFFSGTPSSVVPNILLDVPKETYDMKYVGQGVYSVTVEGDLDKDYYTYVVENSAGKNEVCDPYATSVGVNGVRAQVLDMSKTDPLGFRDITFNKLNSPTDLTVYEMHVADLTRDETWMGTEENRGKYLGLIEEGTTYTNGSVTVKTGFDHIKELGVNAVQIMPFYDQANFEIELNGKEPSHNWGYNPLNFNALEGQYSSAPKKGEVRISEFKQVVQEYAKNDIRIIMDVVYNHMASASSSHFQKIVPGYYFRYNEDGTLNNDSGVGNVFASEMKMAQNYIVDSVCHWAKEYQIKGFRFDLMQLINADTLKAVDNALKQIDPDIVVWGEPWSAAGYWGDMVYSDYLRNTNIAQFNDQGRNGLKGENDIKQNKHYGWISKGEGDNQGDPSFLNRTKGMMAGMIGDYYNGEEYRNDPKKNVQYIGCHDNYTIHDQFLASYGYNEALAARASVVASSILFTSQGIPFFQGGDEILRSKPFDPTTKTAIEFMKTHTYEWHKGDDGVYYSGNSYNIGYDTNSYKWNDKANNLEVFNRYKELINIRKEHPAFRMATTAEIKKDFGYWENVADLSYCAIAAWNTKEAEANGIGAIYSFFIGRLDENDTTKQEISWGEGKVEVLFDSKGELTGQTLTSSVSLERLRSLIVRRITTN
ncbi:MAG: type I pullulanase [Bacilli bacterium]|jgi:pullulanase